MTLASQRLDPLRRLLALLVLVAGVAGIPVGLLWVGGPYLPDRLPSWDAVGAALSGPDTGAVFLGLLVVIGWAAWAVLTLSVAVELAAQLRGTPPLRLPGLSAPQHLAGLLLAAVIGVGAAPLLAAPALAGPPVIVESPMHVPPAASAAAPTIQPAAPRATGVTYTVQPRDTLGRIAARYLGDWTRFQQILDLNRGRPQPDGGSLTDPGLIRPGWVLALPPDATRPGAEPTTGRVIVHAGDTLTGIAEQQGLDSWQRIFDLNADEPQPGGGRFTDPDLLRPGQVLDLPPTSARTPASPVDPEPSAPPPGAEDGQATPGEPVPMPAATPTPVSPSGSPDRKQPAAGAAGTVEDPASAELAAVLAGSGALIAAGVGTVWLASRRRRLRRRGPGRMLAPLPAALSATQAPVLSAADKGRADYAALDLALRGLAVLISADPQARLPDVVAARLSGDRLKLRLHIPADRPPPAPWTADDTGLWWSLTLGADGAVDQQRARRRLAPYPTLVTVGSRDGQRWLLDLERIGALRVSGSPHHRENFSRHLAAELAVNSWSDLLTITTVGFGQEMVDLAPHRLHPVDHLSAAELETDPREGVNANSDVLQGRLHATAGDGWMPHVVLAPHVQDGDDPCELIEAVRAQPDRSVIATVLDAAPTQGTDPWTLTLTDDGFLLIPDLGLRLPAPQLTTQQAGDIAALLAFERDTADAPIPGGQGDRPWQTLTDAAGALRHHTIPPTAPGPTPSSPHPALALSSNPGPPGSALPLRTQIESDLEQLDHDLADWWAPDCQRPRLTLLGPINLRAHGDEEAAATSGLRRRYEEVVAYLATRPHGATVDEAAAALQPTRGGKSDPVSSRAYVHRMTAGARAWLGIDPTTGAKHLSSGHIGRYTLTNVLVDADLFRQLRARGGVRGSDGIADLSAALELVTGPPFAQRTAGYDWLGGLDLTYTAAVCDVAHLVVTAALAEDHLDAARSAGATALLVAPDDEAVLLDAMRVAFHEGNRAEAETYIARIVEVHDGEDEMDLPLSIAETISRARRRYLDHAS